MKTNFTVKKNIFWSIVHDHNVPCTNWPRQGTELILSLETKTTTSHLFFIALATSEIEIFHLYHKIAM